MKVWFVQTKRDIEDFGLKWQALAGMLVARWEARHGNSVPFFGGMEPG